MEQQALLLKRADVLAVLIAGVIVGLGLYPITQVLKISLPFPFWMVPIFLPPFCIICLFIAYLLGKKMPFIFQLSKFVVTGLVNTAVDFSVLNLLMSLTHITGGGYYSVFKGISFVVAVCNSYFWNKFWTFSHQTDKRVGGSEMLKFFIVSGIGFGLNVGIASLVTNVIGVQFGIEAGRWANIGAVGGTLVAMAENFLGYKFLVFKKKNAEIVDSAVNVAGE